MANITGSALFILTAKPIDQDIELLKYKYIY